MPSEGGASQTKLDAGHTLPWPTVSPGLVTTLAGLGFLICEARSHAGPISGNFYDAVG